MNVIPETHDKLTWVNIRLKHQHNKYKYKITMYVIPYRYKITLDVWTYY